MDRLRGRGDLKKRAIIQNLSNGGVAVASQTKAQVIKVPCKNTSMIACFKMKLPISIGLGSTVFHHVIMNPFLPFPPTQLGESATPLMKLREGDSWGSSLVSKGWILVSGLPFAPIHCD